jgi:hypothetical protein
MRLPPQPPVLAGTLREWRAGATPGGLDPGLAAAGPGLVPSRAGTLPLPWSQPDDRATVGSTPGAVDRHVEQAVHLSPEQQQVVSHRGSDLQVIAHGAGGGRAQGAHRLAGARAGRPGRVRALRGDVRRHHPRLLLPPPAGSRPEVRQLRRPGRAPARRPAQPRVPLARAVTPGHAALATDPRPDEDGRRARQRADRPGRARGHATRRGVRRLLGDAGALPLPHFLAAHHAGHYRAGAAGNLPARARVASASHRRRVPGHQPGTGAADRAPRPGAGAVVRRRRRRSGDLPVARVRRGEHRGLSQPAA